MTGRRKWKYSAVWSDIPGDSHNAVGHGLYRICAKRVEIKGFFGEDGT